MKQTFFLLLLFGLGILTSRNVPSLTLPSQALPALLSGLMLFIGLDIGRDETQWKQLRTQSWSVFLLPIVIALGSLAGAVVAAYLLPQLIIKDALLISAGLGYYSLSSVLISAQYSTLIGTIALLSNVLRETTTLVLAPVLVKLFGGKSLIASGGATSMDVCLPTIQEYAGSDFVYPAFVSGFILTMGVPFLVGFLLRI